jgi:large subunit ribosomal protein L7/L12
MATMTNEEIIKAVEVMPVLQLSELVKALEERFARPPRRPSRWWRPPAGGRGGGRGEDGVRRHPHDGAGRQKIQVIKVVRELTSLGLKEAKKTSWRRCQAGEDRGREGRIRDDEEAGRGGREGRDQVAACVR